MNTHQFYNPAEARKKMPVISRPDLVAERNAIHPVYRVDAPTDSRMRCYRPDGTCYAIVAKSRWIKLRETKKLEKFLKKERDSGVILEVGELS